MVRGMEMNHPVRNQVRYERYEQVIHLQVNLDLLVKWPCNFSKIVIECIPPISEHIPPSLYPPFQNTYTPSFSAHTVQHVWPVLRSVPLNSNCVPYSKTPNYFDTDRTPQNTQFRPTKYSGYFTKILVCTKLKWLQISWLFKTYTMLNFNSLFIFKSFQPQSQMASHLLN